MIEDEHDAFTPRWYDLFVKNLASKLAEWSVWCDNDMDKNKLPFEIVRGALLCVRESRDPLRKIQEDAIDNFRLNMLEADLWIYDNIS